MNRFLLGVLALAVAIVFVGSAYWNYEQSQKINSLTIQLMAANTLNAKHLDELSDKTFELMRAQGDLEVLERIKYAHEVFMIRDLNSLIRRGEAWTDYDEYFVADDGVDTYVIYGWNPIVQTHDGLFQIQGSYGETAALFESEVAGGFVYTTCLTQPGKHVRHPCRIMDDLPAYVGDSRLEHN